MRSRLSKDCVILDDAEREAEQQTARRWIEESGGHTVRVGGQKPYFKITLNKGTTSSRQDPAAAGLSGMDDDQAARLAVRVCCSTDCAVEKTSPGAHQSRAFREELRTVVRTLHLVAFTVRERCLDGIRRG